MRLLYGYVGMWYGKIYRTREGPDYTTSCYRYVGHSVSKLKSLGPASHHVQVFLPPEVDISDYKNGLYSHQPNHQNYRMHNVHLRPVPNSCSKTERSITKNSVMCQKLLFKNKMKYHKMLQFKIPLYKLNFSKEPFKKGRSLSLVINKISSVCKYHLQYSE